MVFCGYLEIGLVKILIKPNFHVKSLLQVYPDSPESFPD